VARATVSHRLTGGGRLFIFHRIAPAAVFVLGIQETGANVSHGIINGNAIARSDPQTKHRKLSVAVVTGTVFAVEPLQILQDTRVDIRTAIAPPPRGRLPRQQLGPQSPDGRPILAIAHFGQQQDPQRDVIGALLIRRVLADVAISFVDSRIVRRNPIFNQGHRTQRSNSQFVTGILPTAVVLLLSPNEVQRFQTRRIDLFIGLSPNRSRETEHETNHKE
jgi:hypothetical protein